MAITIMELAYLEILRVRALLSLCRGRGICTNFIFLLLTSPITTMLGHTLTKVQQMPLAIQLVHILKGQDSLFQVLMTVLTTA